MRTYCLVIDDDNQEEYFNTNVRCVLKEEGIDVIPIFVDPTDRKYLKPDYSGLDKDSIIKDCRTKLDTYNVSIIVSDYKIATKADTFTGVDIILDLIETHPSIYKILYSATIKKAIKQILLLLPSDLNTSKLDVDIVTEILTKIAKINEFVSGKGYEQKVIKYLRSPEIQHRQHLINILKEIAPDLVFQSGYPPFIGKTLKEIGVEVENMTA